MYVKPTTQTMESVTAWLNQAGLDAIAMSPAGDWLGVTLPVSQANELLNAEFTVFTHSETGKQTIRTMSYSIPADLEGHLEFVYPTISSVHLTQETL